MMVVRTVALLFAVTLLSTGPSFAQQQDCTKALIVDTYRDQSELSRDFRFSEHLTEKQFEDLKKNFATSGEGIIYGIPVKGNTSYDEYKSKSRELLRQTNIALSE